MHGGAPRGMLLLPRSAGPSTLQLRQPFGRRGSVLPAPCLCLACKTVRCLGTADSRLSEPHHLPVWLISTMLNKRICWALRASAFANLAGLYAASEGYPLAHAEKRGEMVSKKLISLSSSEPSPDHKW